MFVSLDEIKNIGVISANTLVQGDCLEVMQYIPDGSVDTIITDPPYGLSMMNQKWDYDVPGVEVFAEMLRVAKPGAMLLCFGGSRTFHRMAVNIEDAGWELRDTIMWLYGSGFPKSHDISKAIPATPAAKQWDGWGTALKPAFEPIVVAMKPIEGTFANNAQTHGVAGLWIDGGRIEANDGEDRSRDNSVCRPDKFFRGKRRVNQVIPKGQGRWPANILHDGSDEVLAGFPVTTHVDKRKRKKQHQPPGQNGIYGKFEGADDTPAYNDSGSAARYFYCAKASKSERNHGGTVDNRHPTVKPLALLQYLCRITRTPTGGLVLDPFAGSGTTALAAIKSGRQWICIEQKAEYCQIIQERIKQMTGYTYEPPPKNGNSANGTMPIRKATPASQQMTLF